MSGDERPVVLVMFDYTAYPPVWLEWPGQSSALAKSFPLPDPLVRALNSWAEYGDAHMLHDTWADGTISFEEWNDMGRELAREVRAAVPTETAVWFYDEVLDRRVEVLS